MNLSITRAAAHWDLTVRAIRKDMEICGSPERCEFRYVIECTDDALYIIESLIEDEINHKRAIISCLNDLFRQGLAGINPYLSDKNNLYIIESDERFWQISRFVHGISLKRPDYVFDKWRGGVLADFLIDLNKKSWNIKEFQRLSSFSIIHYIQTLIRQIQALEPELYAKIRKVIEFMEKDFAKAHDRFPIAFCHGDFHALNVIWSDSGINAVIDWEFCGIKPEIYDAANMIGCIGIENPEALAGPLVIEFICRLKDFALISDLSWQMLPEFIVALRFAWLSEWLRHKDTEMIDLEIVYMNLLMTNIHDLKHIWKT